MELILAIYVLALFTATFFAKHQPDGLRTAWSVVGIVTLAQAVFPLVAMGGSPDPDLGLFINAASWVLLGISIGMLGLANSPEDRTKRPI